MPAAIPGRSHRAGVGGLEFLTGEAPTADIIEYPDGTMAFNPTVGWGKDGLAYSIRSALDRERAYRAAGWDTTPDSGRPPETSGVCASTAAILSRLTATPRPAISRGRPSGKLRNPLGETPSGPRYPHPAPHWQEPGTVALAQTVWRHQRGQAATSSHWLSLSAIGSPPQVGSRQYFRV